MTTVPERTLKAVCECWQGDRDDWVRQLSQEHLRNIIAAIELRPTIALGYVAETEMNEDGSSPTIERVRDEALLWLGTRGQEGREWGVVHPWAIAMGTWYPTV